jgi:hypothetical protein
MPRYFFHLEGVERIADKRALMFPAPIRSEINLLTDVTCWNISRSYRFSHSLAARCLSS